MTKNLKNEKDEEWYLSVERIIKSLKEYYGIYEDQNLLLREIRALKIGKYEKVRDFNIRYRALYTRLEKKKRKSISVLDYSDSLRGNYEAWKRVSLKGDTITLERAYSLAEKVDRLNTQVVNNSSKDTFWKKQKPINSKIEINSDKNGLNSLHKSKLMTFFYCMEKGHYQAECPKLKQIIEENKKNIFQNEPLN